MAREAEACTCGGRGVWAGYIEQLWDDGHGDGGFQGGGPSALPEVAGMGVVNWEKVLVTDPGAMAALLSAPKSRPRLLRGHRRSSSARLRHHLRTSRPRPTILLIAAQKRRLLRPRPEGRQRFIEVIERVDERAYPQDERSATLDPTMQDYLSRWHPLLAEPPALEVTDPPGTAFLSRVPRHCSSARPVKS